MQFGQKKKDAPDDNGGRYLRNFKDGDLKVRFLEEPPEWIEFREHYKNKQSFPCTRDFDTCPGCQDEDSEVSKSTRKYATNVWMVDQDRVLPFRIPVTLAQRVETRYERNDPPTITNRDYVIMKSGKGMSTVYDLEADEKYSVDIESLLAKGMDINEILQVSWDEVWGDKPETNNATEGKKEDLPSEPERKSESADDSGEDEIAIDEDALYDMTIPQLKDLAVKVGVSVPTGTSKKGLIGLLLENAAG